MDIKIKMCNSIEDGDIEIIENRLNIKYAINGTGKSTIAKAIQAVVEDKEKGTQNLGGLKPFKYRTDTETNNPEVQGLDSINSVAIFNEEYVNQYVFLEDEILKDSFSVFIHSQKYEDGMNEINELIKNIATTFNDNGDIDELLKDLEELSGTLGTAKSLSKASKFSKAFENGNKVEHIPIGLEDYKDFIKHDSNSKWLNWQMKGKDYLNISNCCPYCTSGDIEEKREKIQAIEDNYDAKVIEHLNAVINVIHRLKSYLIDETYVNIIEMSKSVDGLSTEQKSFMMEIREQIQVLTSKLKRIRSIGFSNLKEITLVTELINEYKINLSYISHLNTAGTAEKIDKINISLDEILVKAGQLQGKVNNQKRHIEETITLYNKEINDFLKYAGYNYQVSIEEDKTKNTYKMVLRHNEYIVNPIGNAKNHLSFGEKNAFALVLFMFDVIKSNPDLVILDDPISSFDKNKKFAIVEMLFRGDKSLKDKTVLMLTHDFDPVVDMVLHSRTIFQPLPSAKYLENVEGILTEKTVDIEDIKTFIEIAYENINDLDEQINQLIYLRRLYEVTNDKNLGYELLSNIFHKRHTPIMKNPEREMTQEEIDGGTELIKKYILDFDYASCIDKVLDNTVLVGLYNAASNNYEKLQIYRIINNGNNDNRVIRKFVNETFHDQLQ